MLKPSEENDACSHATCSCLQKCFEPSQDHLYFLTGFVHSVRLHCSGDGKKVYTWAIQLELLFKKDLLYFKLCVYVSMRGFVHVNAGVLGGQKLVLDPRSWNSRQFYPTWCWELNSSLQEEDMLWVTEPPFWPFLNIFNLWRVDSSVHRQRSSLCIKCFTQTLYQTLHTWHFIGSTSFSPAGNNPW